MRIVDQISIIAFPLAIWMVIGAMEVILRILHYIRWFFIFTLSLACIILFTYGASRISERIFRLLYYPLLAENLIILALGTLGLIDVVWVYLQDWIYNLIV
ncbi:MAG: hypothetical protein QXO71_04640 [Candidatus Jordarchaeaceae archaeon]